MGIFDIFKPIPQATEPEKREILWNPVPYTISIDRTYTQTVQISDAMSVSALHAGVSIIAEVLSNLPLHEELDEVQIAPSPLIDNLVAKKGKKKEALYAWTVDYLLNGNMFGIYTDFDLAYPNSIVPVPCRDASARRDGGITTYNFNGIDYPEEQVFHVKGFHLPGDLVGKGVLELGARTIQHALAAQKRSHRNVMNQTPQIVITNPMAMSPDEKRQFKEAWARAFQEDSTAPGILDGGMNANEFGYSNQEQQLLETRQLLINEIAGHLNLDPYWCAGTTDPNTYNTSVKRLNALLNNTIRPITERIEDALSAVLPDGHRARFNLDAVLRADPIERAAINSQAVNKWKTANEIRALEGLPDIDGGDEFKAPTPFNQGDKQNDPA